jgi:hypothetical protein
MGWIGGAAGASFAIALWLLAAFMVTGRARLDRFAEWAFIAFGVLGAVTAAAAGALSQSPVVSAGVTVLGVAGCLGLGIAELGVTLRLVDWRRVELPVTVAFVTVLAWIAAVSALAIGGGPLPQPLGWLGLAGLLSGALAVAASARMNTDRHGHRPSATLVMAVPSLLAVAAWMGWLGSSL